MSEISSMDTRYKVDLVAGNPIHKNIRLYRNKLLQFIARKFLIPPGLRVWMQRLRGVGFSDPKRIFMGEDVFIDEVFPQLVTIGRNVMITEGVMIFTHLYDTGFCDHTMKVMPVVIEDDVFIGARSIILNGARLGKGCVIGAGSIVRSDVPAYAVMAGSPARQIGTRGVLDSAQLATSSDIDYLSLRQSGLLP